MFISKLTYLKRRKRSYFCGKTRINFKFFLEKGDKNSQQRFGVIKSVSVKIRSKSNVKLELIFGTLLGLAVP
jgi:hypothetical protein